MFCGDDMHLEDTRGPQRDESELIEAFWENVAEGEYDGEMEDALRAAGARGVEELTDAILRLEGATLLRSALLLCPIVQKHLEQRLQWLGER